MSRFFCLMLYVFFLSFPTGSMAAALSESDELTSVVPSFFNTGASSATASAADGSYVPPYFNYFYDILSIISILILGVFVYLYLSTGSWQEMKNKLYKFRSYEFVNFLGPHKRRRK